MKQDISIWSPVIITRLPDSRNYKQQANYTLDESFSSIEDIRLKIKNSRVFAHGQAIDAQVVVEMLCLLQDSQGGFRLISRQEALKDSLSILQLDPPLQRDQDCSYIINVQDLYWDGEMKDNTLFITYYLSYMLMATQEQVVNLFMDEEEETTIVTQELPNHNALLEMEKEAERVENENEMLRRKLSFYERDILSLRRGIVKAENRNANLNREVNRYQDLVEQLREAISRKELIICKYESQLNEVPAAIPISDPVDDYKLGKMIKRMFMNSL